MSLTPADSSPAPAPAAADVPVPFAYAGGYAPRCGGIHALTRDGEGRVEARLVATLAGSPTWLHLTKDGRRLHALLEDGHELASFAVEPVSGGLTLLSRHATGGELPVHLCLDEVKHDSDGGSDGDRAFSARGHAWIAHYGDGTLRRAPVAADGALQAPDQLIAPRAGATPHAHMVRRHPRWPLMLASDLGQDLLRVWRIQEEAKAPVTDPVNDPVKAPVELEGLVLPAGSGPRHFVFHPHDDGQLYLLNEQANALDWLGLDASGTLTHRLRLSSLPVGFEGLNYASDLLIAPDGKRLLALNRLHDAVAVFDVDASGRPSWHGETWAQGSYPRSASFSPDGRELWVCLQRSHQICVFAIDGSSVDTGLPRFDGRFIAMPGAACVVFR